MKIHGSTVGGLSIKLDRKFIQEIKCGFVTVLGTVTNTRQTV